MTSQEILEIKSKMLEYIANLKDVLSVKDVREDPLYKKQKIDAIVKHGSHPGPVGFLLKVDSINSKDMQVEYQSKGKTTIKGPIFTTKSFFLLYYFHKIHKVFLINIPEFTKWINDNYNKLNKIIFNTNRESETIVIPLDKLINEFGKVNVFNADFTPAEKQLKTVSQPQNEDTSSKNSETIPHNAPKTMIINGYTYTNLLYRIQFTYDDLDKLVDSIGYKNIQIPNGNEKLITSFPSPVSTFYNLAKLGSIPTLEDFRDTYFYKNSNILLKDKAHISNLINLIDKAYFNMLRNLSACLLLDKLGRPVFLNLSLTQNYGTDFLIAYPSIKYAINLKLWPQNTINNLPETEIVEWEKDISGNIFNIYKEEDVKILDENILHILQDN